MIQPTKTTTPTPTAKDARTRIRARGVMIGAGCWLVLLPLLIAARGVMLSDIILLGVAAAAFTVTGGYLVASRRRS